MKQSFSGIIIDLNETAHQYCIKCRKIMVYHKDNSVCLNCDNGIPINVKNIIST